jgi:hypothetical protein
VRASLSALSSRSLWHLKAYYYTQLVGDARNPPTILASADFEGIAVIDANPYLPGGRNWHINQNNFFRAARNLVIDLRRMPPGASATGLHWQVSQGAPSPSAILVSANGLYDQQPRCRTSGSR